MYGAQFKPDRFAQDLAWELEGYGLDVLYEQSQAPNIYVGARKSDWPVSFPLTIQYCAAHDDPRLVRFELTMRATDRPYDYTRTTIPGCFRSFGAHDDYTIREIATACADALTS